MPRARLGVLVLGILLAGCVADVREEIQVSPDGSVAFTGEMIVPDSLDGWGMPTAVPAPGLVSEGLMDDSVTYRREFVADRKRHHVVTRDFPSLEVFQDRKAMMDPNAPWKRPPYEGVFEVTRLSGKRVRVRYQLGHELRPRSPTDRAQLSDLRRVLAGDSTVTLAGRDSADVMALITLYRDVSYHYVVRGPRIESTNGRRSADGTRAEWDRGMLDLMTDTTAVMEVVLGPVP